VHRVFRREAALLPKIVRAVAERDGAAIARTADAIDEYVDVLRNHHAVEDQLIWPRLRERAWTEALSQHMEKQHAAIDGSLEAVGFALAVWRMSGARSDAEALAAAFDEHRVCLVEHLDEEEALALPQIAEYLTAEEWAEVGARGLERVPRDKLLLALGAILEEATPEEAAYLLSKVPLTRCVMWWIFGRYQYATRVRALRSPIF